MTAPRNDHPSLKTTLAQTEPSINDGTCITLREKTDAGIAGRGIGLTPPDIPEFVRFATAQNFSLYLICVKDAGPNFGHFLRTA